MRPDLWSGLFVFGATRLPERRTFPTFAVLNLLFRILQRRHLGGSLRKGKRTAGWKPALQKRRCRAEARRYIQTS
jgi:hypothetical protein